MEQQCEHCDRPFDSERKKRFCSHRCNVNFNYRHSDDKTRHRSYYWENRERILARAKVRRRSPEYKRKFKDYLLEWQSKNKGKIKAQQARYNARLRREALAVYGGKCVCCGVAEEEFLTFDHKNGGGRRHRESDNKIRSNIHRWLRDNGYPDDFQILCMNCNWAKGKYGHCPHEKQK